MYYCFALISCFKGKMGVVFHVMNKILCERVMERNQIKINLNFIIFMWFEEKLDSLNNDEH
jgi:hypothetical protein